jgi:hypothetical protein
MASKGSKVRLRYVLLYGAAKAKVKPNPDKSVVEANIRIELAKIIRDEIDVMQMADSRAAAIIESLTKQPEEDEGPFQLDLFGEKYGYDPQRLVKDNQGNIIEEEHATIPFKMAELARSVENAGRIATWNNRKTKQMMHFQTWVSAEMMKGRSPLELTWGNCVRETGVLR